MKKKKTTRKRPWDSANVTISATCGDLKRLRRMAKREGMTITALVWSMVHPRLFEMEKARGLV